MLSATVSDGTLSCLNGNYNISDVRRRSWSANHVFETGTGAKHLLVQWYIRTFLPSQPRNTKFGFRNKNRSALLRRTSRHSNRPRSHDGHSNSRVDTQLQPPLLQKRRMGVPERHVTFAYILTIPRPNCSPVTDTSRAWQPSS